MKFFNLSLDNFFGDSFSIAFGKAFSNSLKFLLKIHLANFSGNSCGPILLKISLTISLEISNSVDNEITEIIVDFWNNCRGIPESSCRMNFPKNAEKIIGIADHIKKNTFKVSKGLPKWVIEEHTKPLIKNIRKEIVKAFLEGSHKIIPKNNWPKVVFETIPKRFQRSSRNYFQINCRKNSQINVQKIARKTSKHLLKKKWVRDLSKAIFFKKKNPAKMLIVWNR